MGAFVGTYVKTHNSVIKVDKEHYLIIESEAYLSQNYNQVTFLVYTYMTFLDTAVTFRLFRLADMDASSDVMQIAGMVPSSSIKKER